MARTSFRLIELFLIDPPGSVRISRLPDLSFCCAMHRGNTERHSLFDLQNLSDGYVKVMQWMANFLNIVRGLKDKIAVRYVDFLG